MSEAHHLQFFQPYEDITPQLARSIMNAETGGYKGALLYVSIDNLAMILSSQGNDFTEHTMCDLYRHIQDDVLTQGDSIIRTDKDHFAVIINQCSLEDIDDIAHKIYHYIINYGCKISQTPLQLTGTIGGTDFPHGTINDPQVIISRAYIALNDAQELCEHFSLYSNTKRHESDSKNQLVLANYLQNAFLTDKLKLAFQPVIDRMTGNVHHYEALMRIVDENGNVTSVAPFITVVEKMGFIDVIDSVALKMAVHELQQHPQLHLSVNASSLSIQHPKWLAMATSLISELDIASRLIIEITETHEQHDLERTVRCIASLKQLGCSIALDDFGSGYTSFQQIKNLPIDSVKIDGSYIKDIATNRDNRILVESLIELSHSFGLITVAEFVENQEIVSILSDMEVDFFQGNHFAAASIDKPWLDGTAS